MTIIAPPPNLLPSPEGPSYGPYDVLGLEIGGGDHPRRLNFAQFDAIDWSAEVLRDSDVKLQYTVGDARQLPYEDNHYDHVFSSNLLEHFPADETTAVLTEWARVLKSGGYLELVVPDSMGILRDYFSGAQKWPEVQERLLGSMTYDGNQHYAPFCLGEFPDVIAEVPTLELAWCRHSHSGGGVHSLSVRL